MKNEEIDFDWANNFEGAITVCDRNGVIVYMNFFSKKQFKNYGGEKLIGANLLDCHPEPSKTQLSEMLKNQSGNMYTTEKDGIKKMILQSPLFNEGEFNGFVEISFEIFPNIPNFIRD